MGEGEGCGIGCVAGGGEGLEVGGDGGVEGEEVVEGGGGEVGVGGGVGESGGDEGR